VEQAIMPKSKTHYGTEPSRISIIGAWISLYMLVLSWTPFLPFSVRSVWGYAGLFGLTASLGLTGRTLKALRHQAVRDNLTGLANRLFAETMLKHEVAVATRHKENISVIFADIDRFKPINDRFGHAAGDAVLKQVGKTISETFRECDTLARFGGDEFVMILPRTGSTGANIIVERLRSKIQSLEIPVGNGTLRVTMSFGIACFPEDATSGDDLLKRADLSLYEAKRGGRNMSAMFKDSALVACK
jgi:diguanylate cyclase (GGDEF)-like protein